MNRPLDGRTLEGNNVMLQATSTPERETRWFESDHLSDYSSLVPPAHTKSCAQHVLSEAVKPHLLSRSASKHTVLGYRLGSFSGLVWLPCFSTGNWQTTIPVPRDAVGIILRVTISLSLTHSRLRYLGTDVERPLSILPNGNIGSVNHKSTTGHRHTIETQK